MYKKITIILFFIFSINAYSQTVKETADWINKYSYDIQYVHQIKDGKITLLNKSYTPGWGTVLDYLTIDPKIVNRIFYNVGNDGWAQIHITFNGYNEIDNHHIVNYEGAAKIHPNENYKKKLKYKIIHISIPSGRDTERIAKAYLHLFRIYNKQVKFGDVF